MRILKLQMQVSIDGFAAGPNNEMDWMTWDMDDELTVYINELIETSDTILLGRKMTDGFVNHWENVVKTQPDSSEFPFAKKMVDTPKIVFSKTVEDSKWSNTKLIKGDLKEEIQQLKNQTGEDLIVYGGVDFVSSLIKEELIDEFHLFVNPVILGKGLSVFKDVTHYQKLTLASSVAYPCGITVLKYDLKKLDEEKIIIS